MTPAEFADKVIGFRNSIREAEDRLIIAKRQIESVNRVVATAHWTIELSAGKVRSGGYDRDDLFKVTLPLGFVQQQCVYAVERAARELEALRSELAMLIRREP